MQFASNTQNDKLLQIHLYYVAGIKLDVSGKHKLAIIKPKHHYVHFPDLRNLLELTCGFTLSFLFRRRRLLLVGADPSVYRVVERALEAMRELNGTSAVVKEPCPPSAWEQSKKEQEPAPSCGPTDPPGQKPAKRSRLPAAAVKEMRCVRAS